MVSVRVCREDRVFPHSTMRGEILVGSRGGGGSGSQCIGMRGEDDGAARGSDGSEGDVRLLF
jgi:hypothetical protein